jgi:hypothetical protein
MSSEILPTDWVASVWKTIDGSVFCVIRESRGDREDHAGLIVRVHDAEVCKDVQRSGYQVTFLGAFALGVQVDHPRDGTGLDILRRVLFERL